MPNDTALFPGHRQRSRRSTNQNQTYLLRHLKCIWRVVSDVPECSNSSNDASVSTMKTRSKTLPQINWDYCNFCRQKAIEIENLSAFIILSPVDRIKQSISSLLCHAGQTVGCVYLTKFVNQNLKLNVYHLFLNLTSIL
jgi:hypothetical protein